MLSTVIVLVLALTLTGCPWSSGDTKIVLAGVHTGSTYVSHLQPIRASLRDAAAGLAEASGSTLKIQEILDKIAASDDPFGEALTIATCQGLGQIAEQDRQNDGNVIPPSAQDWERYLNEDLVTLLPPQYRTLISSRVSQFNDAAQLASINPGAARTYLQVCVRGER